MQPRVHCIAYTTRAQERATASFQKALKLLPEDGALWEGLGKAFLGLTRLNAAHKVLRLCAAGAR